MNPVLKKRSTIVVNWHSNILGYRKFSHNILCEICGGPWNVLKEFAIDTLEKIQFFTTFLFKFYGNHLKIYDSAIISW